MPRGAPRRDAALTAGRTAAAPAPPRGVRSPPGGDHVAAVVRIMLDDLEDDLTSLTGDPADVVDEHQAPAEQPPETQSVEMNR